MSEPHHLAAETRLWPIDCAYPLRFLRPDDAIDLGQLLVAAPSLTPSQRPKQLSGWIDWVLGLASGAEGTLLDGCSFVIDGRRGLVGAAIVVRQATGPMLVELAVEPTYQRQGLGTALIAASLTALKRAGYAALTTRVEPNTAHERLLKQSGFTD